MTVATLILAFVALFAVAPSAPADGASVPTVQANRVVAIRGVIARGNLLPLGNQLLAWSHKAPNVPVDIVIDSPGGDVGTGFLFVNQLEAVRARGTRVRCWVPTLAASMAFQILVHCDERYTLDHSWLLWHGVRVFGTGGEPITAESALDLARELTRLNSTILRELNATLGLPAATVRFHFLKETLHVGRDLATLAPGFIQSAPAYPGLMEALASAPRSQAPGLFDTGDVFEPGQIVYMAPDLAQQ
jgi:ATP-dependent protease ClpP protease subunit